MELLYFSDTSKKRLFNYVALSKIISIHIIFDYYKLVQLLNLEDIKELVIVSELLTIIK